MLVVCECYDDGVDEANGEEWEGETDCEEQTFFSFFGVGDGEGGYDC